MLKEELARRNVPELLSDGKGGALTAADWPERRRELKRLVLEEEYGYLPELPERVEAELISTDKEFCAGKAPLKRMMLKVVLRGREFSFPIACVIPRCVQKLPAFIHINFRSDVPDMYMPSEELCDAGFAVFSFCYKDVSFDGDDGFMGGLDAIVYPDGKRRPTDCGKIGLWAWAAQRVLDYALTLGTIDEQRVAVVGHSRLGKTALLAGATDERFAYTISNDSGCGGAALVRGKEGEKISLLCHIRYYWFCENFLKYENREEELPFDQHALLALIAPRGLYVASAEEDDGADPRSEFFSVAAASPVFELLGCKGLVCNGRMPAAGERCGLGNPGYHMRRGMHFFSREDWRCFIDFINSHSTGC